MLFSTPSDRAEYRIESYDRGTVHYRYEDHQTGKRKKKSCRQRMIASFEVDPFGLNEEMNSVIFKCLDCKKTDEVPAYIIGEFGVDKTEGEEVEFHWPYCHGTMIEAKDVSSD